MTLPVIEDIPYIDPLAAFTPFAGREFAQFLDSAQSDGRLGRYSFIVADPVHRIVARDGVICMDDTVVEGCPFAALRDLLSTMRAPTVPGLPPFQGGACGVFGYDLCLGIERLSPPDADDMVFPDMVMGVYDVVIAFDHVEQKSWLISTGLPETDDAARLARARSRAAEFRAVLERAALPDENRIAATAAQVLRWRSNFTRPEYERAVASCIEYIWAGDIFQANLSQRFSADLPENFDSYAQYALLRRHNPAPFAAYQNFGDMVVASSSPERFIRVTGDMVETRPIKGTRPRGADDGADRMMKAALMNSAKDRSENAMIVDLMRNDLSRNCADGTVEVPEFCVLESYAAVHHLVSTVTGRLRDGATALDLLRDGFPGGSITGAPKVRAMEIIAELEPTRRGPYCGAIGYVGFDGTMDTNIAIRTLTLRNNTACFQAGGGIVADSEPASEYLETLAKAHAIFDSFEATPHYDAADEDEILHPVRAGGRIA